MKPLCFYAKSQSSKPYLVLHQYRIVECNDSLVDEPWRHGEVHRHHHLCATRHCGYTHVPRLHGPGLIHCIVVCLITGDLGVAGFRTGNGTMSSACFDTSIARKIQRTGNLFLLSGRARISHLFADSKTLKGSMSNSPSQAYFRILPNRRPPKICCRPRGDQKNGA
jgi:hypothetical protein